jgi:hypothetical protein
MTRGLDIWHMTYLCYQLRLMCTKAAVKWMVVWRLFSRMTWVEVGCSRTIKQGWNLRVRLRYSRPHSATSHETSDCSDEICLVFDRRVILPSIPDDGNRDRFRNVCCVLLTKDEGYGECSYSFMCQFSSTPSWQILKTSFHLMYSCTDRPRFRKNSA